MSTWSDLGDRVAGKWQVPLLAISVVALAASFLNIKPTPRDYPVAEAVRELDRFLSDGRYGPALRFAKSVFEVEGPTEEQMAPVHLRVARALVARAAINGTGSSTVGSKAGMHFQLARDHGLSLTVSDHEQWGRAFEWQSIFGEAVDHYDRVLDASDLPRLDLRRHVLSLRMEKLDLPLDESQSRLEAFLRITGDRMDLGLWAIERLVDVLHDQGKSEAAATLLAQHKAQFMESDLRDRFAYLNALVLYRTDAADEAELLLRVIRNRVKALDDVDAMSGYLLGRIVLGEDGSGRPFEAISFFENVIATHALGPYRVASRLGIAEALVSLQRESEAIDAYRLVMEERAQLGDHRLVNGDVIRVSLMLNSDRARRRQQFEAALGYASMAGELIDADDVDASMNHLQQLGELHESFGRLLQRQADRTSLKQGDDGPQQRAARVEDLLPMMRQQFHLAGDTFVKLTQRSEADQDRAAAAHFLAAELYDRALDRAGSADLYQSFVTDYPTHVNRSLALLRLGHVRRELGMPEEAVEAFRRCRSEFPLSLNGARALLPLARSYLAMVPAKLEMAEKTLMLILDDSRVFTPEAREYADGLFLLGDVLNRQGEFERAITVLEEGRQRYPNAPQTWRALYVLADSHRRSGMALKQDLKDARYAGEANQIQNTYRRRLSEARRLYRSLIDHYDATLDSEKAGIDRVYERYAVLYEADCLFENMQYDEAVRLYEAAVGLLTGSTAALSAYIQIINCQAFLGRAQEARAALTRAQVLVRSLPQESFGTRQSPQSRRDWQRYLSWLERSELF